jgi:DnaJ-like protein
MSLEKFVEEQVRRAIEAGEFDNLRGKGKPLDLRAYFETPEDLRLAYSLLKSNDFVPEEVELLREIQGLKDRFDSSRDETEKQRLKKDISDKTLTFRMMIEKPRPRR